MPDSGEGGSVRSSVIAVRTSNKLRKALEKISASERRSLSSVIEGILEEYIRARRPKAKPGEKRLHPRMKTSAPALVSGLNGNVLAGVINDISLGGVNLSLCDDFPHHVRFNSKLSVVFTLSVSETPLVVQCSPRHVRSDEGKSIGASLTDTDFHSYRLLEDYLAQMASTGNGEEGATAS